MTTAAAAATRHRDLKSSWMSILTFPYDWKIYYATERETPQRVKSKQHFYGGSAEINDHYLFHLDVWCFRENVSRMSYGVAAVLNPFRVSPKSLRFPLFSPPSIWFTTKLCEVFGPMPWPIWIILLLDFLFIANKKSLIVARERELAIRVGCQLKCDDKS